MAQPIRKLAWRDELAVDWTVICMIVLLVVMSLVLVGVGLVLVIFYPFRRARALLPKKQYSPIQLALIAELEELGLEEGLMTQEVELPQEFVQRRERAVDECREAGLSENDIQNALDRGCARVQIEESIALRFPFLGT